MSENVKIETYVKRVGGKVYRQGLFFVGSRCIVVEDILCKDDAAAYRFACKCLRAALEL